MWILPIFLKPGKCDFVIRTPKDPKIDRLMKLGARPKQLDEFQRPEDAAFKFHYKRHIVDIREEKIPLCKYTELFKSNLFIYLFCNRLKKAKRL